MSHRSQARINRDEKKLAAFPSLQSDAKRSKYFDITRAFDDANLDDIHNHVNAPGAMAELSPEAWRELARYAFHVFAEDSKEQGKVRKEDEEEVRKLDGTSDKGIGGLTVAQSCGKILQCARASKVVREGSERFGQRVKVAKGKFGEVDGEGGSEVGGEAKADDGEGEAGERA